MSDTNYSQTTKIHQHCELLCSIKDVSCFETFSLIIASEPIECRWRVDHDFLLHIFVVHPIPKGIHQIPIVGIGNVLVGMGPVGTPHDPIGSALYQCLCHGFDIVIGWKIRFTDAIGASNFVFVRTQVAPR